MPTSASARQDSGTSMFAQAGAQAVLHGQRQLHAACAALGTRLFTVTVQDLTLDVARRAYTSHPVEYPVSGTKPLTRDGWYDHCITGQQVFVANTTPEFAKYFFDHALITSLGLGACINIPVVQRRCWRFIFWGFCQVYRLRIFGSWRFLVIHIHVL